MVPHTKQRLSESAVKNALDALSWPALKAHLDQVAFNEALVDELLGHVRRCVRLLLKYRDPGREARRDELLDKLAAYLKDRLSEDARSRCDGERAKLRLIESDTAASWRAWRIAKFRNCCRRFAFPHTFSVRTNSTGISAREYAPLRSVEKVWNPWPVSSYRTTRAIRRTRFATPSSRR
jgi:hypothetical protein